VGSSRSGRFICEERAPGTHETGGCEGSISGLDAAAKKRKSLHCPCRESNLGRPVRSLATILTELLRFRVNNMAVIFMKNDLSWPIIILWNQKSNTTYMNIIRIFIPWTSHTWNISVWNFQRFVYLRTQNPLWTYKRGTLGATYFPYVSFVILHTSLALIVTHFRYELIATTHVTLKTYCFCILLDIYNIECLV
jgi:hypothetical protein